MHKVLMDVSYPLRSKEGLSGLQTAVLFSGLADRDVSLSGFMYAEENDIFFRPQLTSVRSEAIEDAHYFFHDAFNHENVYFTKLLKILKLQHLFKRMKKEYLLYPIDKIYRDVIWRNIFERYLSFQAREIVLHKSFYFTDLSLQWQSKARLNTSNYHFVIFPFMSRMKIATDSQKIIMLQQMTDITETNIRACQLSTYFVCTEPNIREKLLSIFPELAERSRVIEMKAPETFARAWVDLLARLRA